MIWTREAVEAELEEVSSEARQGIFSDLASGRTPSQDEYAARQRRIDARALGILQSWADEVGVTTERTWHGREAFVRTITAKGVCDTPIGEGKTRLAALEAAFAWWCEQESNR